MPVCLVYKAESIKSSPALIHTLTAHLYIHPLSPLQQFIYGADYGSESIRKSLMYRIATLLCSLLLFLQPFCSPSHTHTHTQTGVCLTHNYLLYSCH